MLKLKYKFINPAEIHDYAKHVSEFLENYTRHTFESCITNDEMLLYIHNFHTSSDALHLVHTFNTICDNVHISCILIEIHFVDNKL